VLTAWAARHGLQPDREALLAWSGSHEATIEREHPTDLYPDVLARSMRALGDDLGLEVSQQDTDALATSVPEWPVFSDSPGALCSLAKRYRLIILSNVDWGSFSASNAKLGVEFTSVLTAQDIGSYSPTLATSMR
jgi:putative hydrolase of the HAD superfamily